jgi:hypothetical protein
MQPEATATTEAMPALSGSLSSDSSLSQQQPAPAVNKKKVVTMSPSVEDKNSDRARQDSNQTSKTSFVSESEVLEDLETGRKMRMEDLPRLVLRNRPFHQSDNKVHIQHNLGWRVFTLLRFNWFHAFLRRPFHQSLLLLMSAWTGAILIFAGIYVWYDQLDTSISCGLGKVDEPMTFGPAFAFSLETCTTVGK